MAMQSCVLLMIGLGAILTATTTSVNGDRGALATENGLLSLGPCADGKVIQIQEARYGNGCNCSCDAGFTNLAVRSKCQGEQTCSFTVTSALLGDPGCGGKPKAPNTLLVTYACVPDYENSSY
ncbi:uncharacterized protein LOC129589186 [Paramacrobiotus metropolitanus]|uniref:uncharacterized protein LOC129589186 n=1 Tax=Paramacrobiotus metropolitanus TaxID=2943436 RepID=UPI002445A0EC|nr:uncharacterized protein LOC129589186 [Paramacrobiotus metropolitanus]